MVKIAKIKINGTRTIELLAEKKNPSAEHIKIGNYWAELTDDKTKTNGNPLPKFSKNGKIKYIKEKFDYPVQEEIIETITIQTRDDRGIKKKITIPQNHTIKNAVLKLKVQGKILENKSFQREPILYLDIPEFGVNFNKKYGWGRDFSGTHSFNIQTTKNSPLNIDLTFVPPLRRISDSGEGQETFAGVETKIDIIFSLSGTAEG